MNIDVKKDGKSIDLLDMTAHDSNTGTNTTSGDDIACKMPIIYDSTGCNIRCQNEWVERYSTKDFGCTLF